MIVKTSTHNGDYEVQLLNHPGFENDFAEWMSGEVEKIAKDCFASFNEMKVKYPDQFYADGKVAFEVTVSIINVPKDKKTKK